MEPLTPITPNPVLTEEIKDIKEYRVNYLNKNYLVKLGKLIKSEKIVFIIEEIDRIRNYTYKSEFTLDDLKELSKLFRIFDSIDEVYNDISDIKIKNVELIELDINLILTSLSSKAEDICIKLKRNNLNNEKINEIIFKELNEIKTELKEEKLKNENLKKIVDELIKENNELKEEKLKNENLKKIVDELVRKNNLLENKVKELFDWKNSQPIKTENNSYNNKNENNFKKLIDNKIIKAKVEIDSKIIKTKEEIELLSKRLTSKCLNKNSKIIFNLLYRDSRDGDTPYNYHRKCDGKQNTLCVIQTIKGYKFGGYTEITISSVGSDVKDPNAFVFSLDKNKIYENLKKENFAVCHSKNWGPIFRNDAFAVWDQNFLSYHLHTVGTKSNSNYGIMNEDYELNNGKENFGIKELEVYQIIIQ